MGGWRGRRGTRYITDPVTASSWAEPGLAQRRSSLRVRVHVPYRTLWSAGRERGETESPWPTRGSASCQDASSHSQLGNMCVDPKPRALEGDHSPSKLAGPLTLFKQIGANDEVTADRGHQINCVSSMPALQSDEMGT